MTFGEKLKFYRKKAGYTQAQFAKVVEMGTNTIINYENGNTHPQKQEIYGKLAKKLGVPADALKDDSIDVETFRMASVSSASPFSSIVQKTFLSSDETDRKELNDNETRSFAVRGSMSAPKEMATQMAALFAGGRVPEEDKDEIMRILNEAYFKSKGKPTY